MSLEAESRALAIAALAERPPVDLLRTPLDYIFADHFRQRSLCRILGELAGAAFDRAMARAALDFLRTDFSLHVLDEEKDLFPLLRKRRQRQDRIGDILARLGSEHSADALDAEQIVAALTGALDEAARAPLDEAARALFARFATNERRHLTAENAIVLPLARARLTDVDLESLGRHMAARRGVTYPEARNAV